jgi:3-hydroxyisobutyrate dehydrogenase-like beta-hydroxyacid dehydrogenase
VTGCATLAEALSGAGVVLSLVTADQALAAARDAARTIAEGAIYVDMNSVAPETKRAAATMVGSAGGRYVDVAVMAPVDPTRLATPLLISGPHAQAGRTALSALGFTATRAVDGAVGRASAIKMIRSVMIKGAEALTAECLLAAEAAGVTAEVVASLGAGWSEKADYNLDRMLVHGRRRAAEMDEVVKTLIAVGVDPAMSRGAAARQRAVGALGVTAPPPGLAAKLAALTPTREAHAA